jgi:GntR family transcriptional regulator, carbon starvation induced regulator
MNTAVKLTQADAVRHGIRTEILQGSLRPGEKLNIKAQEQRFGVSLGAIREALSGLVAEGLVVVEAHRGYHVMPVSREDLLDMTETRVEIESLCLRKAIELGDVEWESRIVAAGHRLDRLWDSPNLADTLRGPAWSQAHGEFHRALAAGCASPWLMKVRELLFAQSERYRLISVQVDYDPNELRDVRREHRELMDVALRRDVRKAMELIRDHLMRTTKTVLRSPLLR